MVKFKNVIKSSYYWLEKNQNELFRQLKEYMDKKRLTQSDIAKDLKVSKSYVSQILNGHFNFTLKKLIELSLYLDKIPIIKYVDLNEYLELNNRDEQKKFKPIENSLLLILKENKNIQKPISFMKRTNAQDNNFKDYYSKSSQYSSKAVQIH